MVTAHIMMYGTHTHGLYPKDKPCQGGSVQKRTSCADSPMTDPAIAFIDARLGWPPPWYIKGPDLVHLPTVCCSRQLQWPHCCGREQLHASLIACIAISGHHNIGTQMQLCLWWIPVLLWCVACCNLQRRVRNPASLALHPSSSVPDTVL